MNTITIKRIKLSMSESALSGLQLHSKRLRECAYDEPCKLCIHQACGSYGDNVALMVDALLNDKQPIDADDMAWARNHARELGFVPVSEVTQ